MSKLEDLANEKFEGDKNKAIKFLISEADGGTLDEIINDCSQKEADLILKFIFKNVKGTKKTVTNGMKKARSLAFLEMTEEEVKKATSNPYKATLIKSIIRFLIIEGVIIGLSFALHYDFVSIIGVVITGLLVSDMAEKMIKYMRFNGLQKHIKKEQNEITSKNV